MKKYLILLLCFSSTANADFEYKIDTGSDSSYVKTMPGDSRRVRDASSPEWVEAIGRMSVAVYAPNEDWPRELQNCTMSLVAVRPNKRSKIAVTAAHCIRGWSDGGNSQTRQFNIPNEDHVAFWSAKAKGTCIRQGNREKYCGAQFRRIVAVHAYESSPGDYAIVELNDYVDDVTALVAGPFTADFEHSFLREDGEYHDAADFRNFKYWVTGYSTDIPLGDRGRHLTYDEGCFFNGGYFLSAERNSSCYSYGGASGGAFVLTVTIPPNVGELPDECIDEEWGYDWKNNVEIDDPRIPPGYDHMWCDHLGSIYYPTGHLQQILEGDIVVLVGVLKGGIANTDEWVNCKSDRGGRSDRTMQDVINDPENCYVVPAEQNNDSSTWTPIEYFRDTLIPILEKY